MYCTKCGTRATNNAVFCSGCGASLSNSSNQPLAPAQTRGSLLPAGAILLYIAGGMGILSAIWLTVIGSINISWSTFPLSLLGIFYPVAGIAFFPLSAVAIFSGRKARQRSSFKWAIAGGICGAITSGIAGILACVFIGMSKHEFTDK